MLEQVGKKVAKKWEHTTTPLMNVFSSGSLRKLQLVNMFMDLLWWYGKHDLKTTKERKNFLKSRWGTPLYHVCYEYREAVWAFHFEEDPVLIYYSTKGMSVQVELTMDADKAERLIRFLNASLA